MFRKFGIQSCDLGQRIKEKTSFKIEALLAPFHHFFHFLIFLFRFQLRVFCNWTKHSRGEIKIKPFYPTISIHNFLELFIQLKRRRKTFACLFFFFFSWVFFFLNQIFNSILFLSLLLRFFFCCWLFTFSIETNQFLFLKCMILFCIQ